MKNLENPEKLLATILVANNFVNVGIVILTAYITGNLITFVDAPVLDRITSYNVCYTKLLRLIPGKIKRPLYIALPFNFIEIGKCFEQGIHINATDLRC